MYIPVSIKEGEVFLLRNYAMKTWRSGGILPTTLTSTLYGDEWSASHPRRFNLGEIASGTRWIV
jgi:hypothetical protein